MKAITLDVLKFTPCGHSIVACREGGPTHDAMVLRTKPFVILVAHLPQEGCDTSGSLHARRSTVGSRCEADSVSKTGRVSNPNHYAKLS